MKRGSELITHRTRVTYVILSLLTQLGIVTYGPHADDIFAQFVRQIKLRR